MLRDGMEDGFSPGSMLHLWTAQTDAVLDCIRENGFSQVKMEFIDKSMRRAPGCLRRRTAFLNRGPGSWWNRLMERSLLSGFF